MRPRLRNIVAAPIIMAVWLAGCTADISKQKEAQKDTANLQVHTAPDTADIPHNEFGEMVRYGRELIINTPYYIGPDGSVSKNLNNKMSCNNCHLDAGTRPFGLNFFSTHGRYPQYRGRENRILTLEERINNCIERPHNGVGLPLGSKELVAMACYIKWISAGVPAGERVYGDGAVEVDYPADQANVENGERIYALHCSECHGAEGQGVWKPDSTGYVYPPLWGDHSYAAGSSMNRVLKAARFIKANMPHLKSTWERPLLSDQDAIDVAAFINDDRIHPRPQKRNVTNYPVAKYKPIDYDRGPFMDTFSEQQHKFGPYQPIIDYHRENGIPVIF